MVISPPFACYFKLVQTQTRHTIVQTRHTIIYRFCALFLILKL